MIPTIQEIKTKCRPPNATLLLDNGFQYQVINNLIKNDNKPIAILGPEGSGKKTAAMLTGYSLKYIISATTNLKEIESLVGKKCLLIVNYNEVNINVLEFIQYNCHCIVFDKLRDVSIRQLSIHFCTTIKTQIRATNPPITQSLLNDIVSRANGNANVALSTAYDLIINARKHDILDMITHRRLDDGIMHSYCINYPNCFDQLVDAVHENSYGQFADISEMTRASQIFSDLDTLTRNSREYCYMLADQAKRTKVAQFKNPQRRWQPEFFNYDSCRMRIVASMDRSRFETKYTQLMGRKRSSDVLYDDSHISQPDADTMLQLASWQLALECNKMKEQIMPPVKKPSIIEMCVMHMNKETRDVGCIIYHNSPAWKLLIEITDNLIIKYKITQTPVEKPTKAVIGCPPMTVDTPATIFVDRIYDKIRTKSPDINIETMVKTAAMAADEIVASCLTYVKCEPRREWISRYYIKLNKVISIETIELYYHQFVLFRFLSRYKQ